MRTSLLISLALLAVALACGPSEGNCNGACYNPQYTLCLQDFDGSMGLCPTGTQICNKACYSPSAYHCVNGNLMGGAAPASSTQNTPSTQNTATPSTQNSATPSTTTGNSGNQASTTQKVVTPTTTSASPAQNPASSTQNSGNSANPSTTTQNAASPSTSSGSGTCAQASYCGAGLCACNGACYTQGVYCCDSGTTLKQAGQCSNPGGAASATPSTQNTATPSTQNSATPSTQNSGNSANPSTTTQNSATPSSATANSGNSGSSSTTAQSGVSGAAPVSVPSPCGNGCPSGLCNCNGACYTAGQYNCPSDLFLGSSVSQMCQGNWALCNKQCFDSTRQSCVNGKLVSGASPVATKATTAAPVVSPTPSPYPQFPAQTADLRIINSCKSTLWLEARYGNAGAPLPGQTTTAQIALPGSYIDYTVPDTGLSGSRFWAKYGCDSNGKNCKIGDQMQYWPNPPGGCPAGGCTPPIDSLFEATWGCRPGSSCNTQNPTTWFDTSQVDGWTIPYKLTPVGDVSGCDCGPTGCGFKGVDASLLDVAKCPSGEDLTASGQFPSIVSNGQTVSLSSVDLRIINNGSILGCMSPCKRLNWGAPYGLQQSESSGSPLWMCCPTPTPNNCTPANGCITADACHAGPIVKTKFVSAVHTMAPGVYSYSYDDGIGLHACPAGVTKYTMEFCPAGSAAYPGTA